MSMSADKNYLIEINDRGADVLEYRKVAYLDWTEIELPAEAYFFAFYDEAQRREPVSGWFYLTADPRILTAAEALEEFPDYAETIAQWSGKGVTAFANHAYDLGPSKGGRIIPLLHDCTLIDRKAMTRIWPPSA